MQWILCNRPLPLIARYPELTLVLAGKKGRNQPITGKEICLRDSVALSVYSESVRDTNRGRYVDFDTEDTTIAISTELVQIIIDFRKAFGVFDSISNACHRQANVCGTE